TRPWKSGSSVSAACSFPFATHDRSSLHLGFLPARAELGSIPPCTPREPSHCCLPSCYFQKQVWRQCALRNAERCAQPRLSKRLQLSAIIMRLRPTSPLGQAPVFTRVQT